MKRLTAIFSLLLVMSCSSAEVRNEKCLVLIDLISDTQIRGMILDWVSSLPDEINKNMARASGRFRGMGAFQVPFPKEFSATSLGLPQDSEILVALDDSNKLQDVIIATAQGVGIYIEPNGDPKAVALYTIEEGRHDAIGVVCLRPEVK